MQRRSTPHLITARDRVIREGRLGTIGLVEIYCYYHMRATQNPPDTPPPDYLDYEMWTGPAPMRPYNSLVHPRSWRAFMEYGNGIVGDMCVHMLDMVRWMLDLGMPTRVSSSGGILIDKASKANITDSQTATFDFPNLQVVWIHRSYGDAPDPKYPWAATFYGDKGTLKAGVMGYDFVPSAKDGTPLHEDVVYELEQFPEDKTEKDLERHVAPAIRGHMKNFLACVESREKPVSDIEQGYMSATACILANLSMKLGRSLQWDHARGMVVGDAEANTLLRRPYRAPWVHPDPAYGLTAGQAACAAATCRLSPTGSAVVVPKMTSLVASSNQKVIRDSFTSGHPARYSSAVGSRPRPQIQGENDEAASSAHGGRHDCRRNELCGGAGCAGRKDDHRERAGGQCGICKRRRGRIQRARRRGWLGDRSHDGPHVGGRFPEGVGCDGQGHEDRVLGHHGQQGLVGGR